MSSQALPVIQHVDGQPLVELSFVGGPQDGLVLSVSFEEWGEPGLVDWQFGIPGGDESYRYLSLDDYEPGVTANLTLEYIGITSCRVLLKIINAVHKRRMLRRRKRA